MTPITFDVLGVPAPQGSKQAFTVNGRARMTEAGGTKATQWRDAVAQAARNVAPDVPLDGPLCVSIGFRFPMPASRPKRVRDARWTFKTTAPDIDKLVRSCLDALTAAAVIADDARVVDLSARKYEVVGWTGAKITVIPLREATA